MSVEASCRQMTVSRDNDSPMYSYKGDICGTSGRDVSCAWLIVAVFLLGLIVLSFI